MSLHPLLQLQQIVGNQGVQRLLRSGYFQAKLKIGQPNDMYEQEADRVAEHVMRMPGRGVSGTSKGPANIQRKCTACESGQGFCPQCAEEEEAIQPKPLARTITPLIQLQSEELEEGDEEEILQTKETPGHAPGVTPDIAANIDAMRGGGQPLPQSVRAFFEPRFEYNFSQVRMHTDTRAAETARAVNARAFTVGQDVVMGEGQYAPNMTEGRKLLAHELTHVVQQKSMNPQIQRHGEHGGLTPEQRYVQTLEHAGTNQADWEADLDRNATFLGVAIRRGIHQELVNRLTIAERYLRNQHPDLSDTEIVNLIGLYSISGLRAPRNAVGGTSITNHAYGIAIDVNYRGNPFIGRSEAVDEIIARATELMLAVCRRKHFLSKQTTIYSV